MEKDELIKERTKKYEELEYRIENRWKINQRNKKIRASIKGTIILEHILPFIASAVIVANSPLVKNNPSYDHSNYIKSTISNEENETEPILPDSTIFSTTPEIDKEIVTPSTKWDVFEHWFIIALALALTNEWIIAPRYSDFTKKILVSHRNINIDEYYALKRSLLIQKKNLEMLTTQDISRSLKKNPGEL